MMPKLRGKLEFTSISSLQLGQKMHVNSLETSQFEVVVPNLIDIMKKRLHSPMRIYLNKTSYILMLIELLH